jgi:rSAM/selenodomain-associated transferase 2
MRTIQEHICISVVIPVLNAAEELPKALVALAESALVGEIIVVDGGSRDGGAAIARRAGARMIDAPRGRGTQLAAGAAEVAGDWSLFLHADCRLGAGWEDAVRAFVTAPGAAGRAGYFDLALDDDVPAARRLERLVRWRCQVLALPYGDQGLLIHRTLYDRIGGYEAIPLMEDVDIVRRLGRARLKPIGATITTSAKRYQHGGYWWRPLRNLFCLLLYVAGVPPARIAKIYG